LVEADGRASEAQGVSPRAGPAISVLPCLLAVRTGGSGRPCRRGRGRRANLRAATRLPSGLPQDDACRRQHGPVGRGCRARVAVGSPNHGDEPARRSQGPESTARTSTWCSSSTGTRRFRAC